MRGLIRIILISIIGYCSAGIISLLYFDSRLENIEDSSRKREKLEPQDPIYLLQRNEITTDCQLSKSVIRKIQGMFIDKVRAKNIKVLNLEYPVKTDCKPGDLEMVKNHLKDNFYYEDENSPLVSIRDRLDLLLANNEWGKLDLKEIKFNPVMILYTNKTPSSAVLASLESLNEYLISHKGEDFDEVEFLIFVEQTLYDLSIGKYVDESSKLLF